MAAGAKLAEAVPDDSRTGKPPGKKGGGNVRFGCSGEMNTVHRMASCGCWAEWA
jgi:hypothetical protein